MVGLGLSPNEHLGAVTSMLVTAAHSLARGDHRGLILMHHLQPHRPLDVLSDIASAFSY